MLGKWGNFVALQMLNIMNPVKILIPVATLLLIGGGEMRGEIVNISTPNTSLVLDAEKGGGLKILHYGDKMNDSDIANLKDAGAINRDAYPV